MSGAAAASLLDGFSTLFLPFFHLLFLHFEISSMNRTPVSYWRSEISLNNFLDGDQPHFSHPSLFKHASKTE